jgi:hypothetical protein
MRDAKRDIERITARWGIAPQLKTIASLPRNRNLLNKNKLGRQCDGYSGLAPRAAPGPRDELGQHARSSFEVVVR